MFWEMHDSIYQNQPALGLPLLLSLAGALGLSETELRDALLAGTYRPKVRADFLGGVRSGVNGTPTFFVDGHRHEGSFAFDSLVTAIERSLSRVKVAL
jgi:protein-disulfide isomerase